MNKKFIQQVEKRQPTDFPVVDSTADLLNVSIYSTISKALSDRMVLHSGLVFLKRNLDYYLFHRRNFGAVDIGEDGWFFMRNSYFQKDETSNKIVDGLHRIHAFLKNYPNDKPELLMVIPPAKPAIYPEKLSTICKKYISKGKERSKIQRRFFKENPLPRVLPLWENYIQAKTNISENLFYQKGTHHTPVGALVMCRAIVEKLHPGIWREEELVDKGVIPWCGDLSLMSGLGKIFEDRHDVDIKRHGVELVSNKLTDVPQHSSTASINYISKSQDQFMIKGRTLFLHDSMMAYSRETMRQFFEDITFAHYESVYDEGVFKKMIESYDRVILEVAERQVLYAMGQILDGYFHSTLYEMDENDLKYTSYNNDITLKLKSDGVHIEVIGNDPIIYLPTRYMDYDCEYQVSVEMDSKVSTYSQLFYLDNENQDFSQECSRIKPVVLGTNYLNFILPADSFYYPKRFDPSMRPGDFVIKSIRMRRLSGEPICAGTPRARPKAWIHSIIISENADVVIPAWDPSAEGNPTSQCKIVPDGMLVTADRNDPFFILPPVPSVATGSEPVLVLELDVPETSVCQVFYRQSNTAVYSEEQSQQQPVRLGFNLLRFKLEPEILQYPLRIDPGTGKGRYLIRSARIEGIIFGAKSYVELDAKRMPIYQGNTVHMIYPSALLKKVLPEESSAQIKVMQQTIIQKEPGELILIAQGNNPYLYLSQLMEKIVEGYYKIVINLQSPGSTSAQLFYLDNNNQDYNEKNSILKKMHPGKNQLEYILEAEAFKKPLKFDYACNPGIYKLKSLEIHKITVIDHRKPNRRF